MPYRKFSRPTNHRRALLRNITTSLLKHGKIVTTEPKAKELRRIADKMITLGKQGDLHARRQALAFIQEESVVTHLFKEIAPKYATRQGGYTRVLKAGFRRGDAAPMCIVELV
ncbi:50S ribosomal protein l17 [Heliomicrobium modesticaldum Ice1]|uniref:Large ribosomal subunit protein bL17 n=1 Tax=Heliobacterium modesticaldum (strain ATCC 51547 / Ice1) TaxID=498761 RepID=RL17_HELMI|nr:50S ribosomal protein L17 [Heliomicrobium modesticaldum]B0TC86.1 RecName: Full=Large ribosomal subunit protein bL17; AltName: Full=50S ribosomal protein L17 [Heliomicrobium modesticaldum Ice1]ABZ83985.1 50S ribosomal protein l17 [Heliomicrobium modesticaldum Ice1]